MSPRIKPKEKYVRISMKEIWRNLNGPPKNKELWSYVVSFEFSRPKVAQIGRKEGNVLFNDALNTFYLRYVLSSLWDDTYKRTLPAIRKE